MLEADGYGDMWTGGILPDDNTSGNDVPNAINKLMNLPNSRNVDLSGNAFGKDYNGIDKVQEISDDEDDDVIHQNDRVPIIVRDLLLNNVRTRLIVYFNIMFH